MPSASAIRPAPSGPVSASRPANHACSSSVSGGSSSMVVVYPLTTRVDHLDEGAPARPPAHPRCVCAARSECGTAHQRRACDHTRAPGDTATNTRRAGLYPGLMWASPDRPGRIAEALQLLLAQGVIDGLELREGDAHPYLLTLPVGLVPMTEHQAAHFLVGAAVGAFGRGVPAVDTHGGH